MKFSLAILLLPLQLTSCATAHHTVQNTSQLEELVGKEVLLARELYLYRAAPHQFEFSPFVVSRGKQTVPPGKSAPFTFIEEWPTDKQVRISEVKIVRRAGEQWLILLGESFSESQGESVIFEYLVGIVGENVSAPFTDRPIEKK